MDVYQRDRGIPAVRSLRRQGRVAGAGSNPGISFVAGIFNIGVLTMQNY